MTGLIVICSFLLCSFLSGFLICLIVNKRAIQNDFLIDLLESVLKDLEGHEHKDDLKHIVPAVIIRIKISLDKEIE